MHSQLLAHGVPVPSTAQHVAVALFVILMPLVGYFLALVIRGKPKDYRRHRRLLNGTLLFSLIVIALGMCGHITMAPLLRLLVDSYGWTPQQLEPFGLVQSAAYGISLLVLPITSLLVFAFLLVDAYAYRVRHKRTGCRHCGYNLQGRKDDVCPECGMAIPTQ